MHSFLLDPRLLFVVEDLLSCSSSLRTHLKEVYADSFAGCMHEENGENVVVKENTELYAEVLTTHSCAVGECCVHLWVHVDGKILHLYDLGVPGDHPCLHPFSEGVTDHGVDNVDDELFRKLHDLLGNGEILEYLTMLLQDNKHLLKRQ